MDTGMCTFLYWVTEMATKNTWIVPAPKQPVAKKTAAQKADAKQRTAQVTAAPAAAKPLADTMRVNNQLARTEEVRLHQVAMDEFLGANEASTLQYFGSSLHRGLLKGSGNAAESGLSCLHTEDMGEAEVIFQRVTEVLDGLVNYPWYADGLSEQVVDAEASLCRIRWNIARKCRYGYLFTEAFWRAQESYDKQGPDAVATKG
ncbi:hypothetical protein B484DRAFT_408954, partial [Ochromonadaceae sp. CCMP2298]